MSYSRKIVGLSMNFEGSRRSSQQPVARMLIIGPQIGCIVEGY
jgi:hypothetical protein